MPISGLQKKIELLANVASSVVHSGRFILVRAFIVAVVFLASIPGVGGAVRAQQRELPTLRDEVKASTTRQSSPQATTATQQRQNQDDVIRVDTNLITIPATVMDRDGRYITDLRKEDFQIYEDGIEQEVAWVAPVEQPFTILFLLDTSGSMGYRLQDLAAAANAFVRQLRLNDRLISATFNDTVQVQWEATAVKEVLDSKRFRLRGGGNTLLYDAVDYALKRMKKVEGRKAIVLFSDGYGSGVFASEKSTLRKAEEQDALIYTVQFDTAPKEPPRNVNKKYFYDAVERADRYMRDLAQRTGGRPYQVDTLSDLGQAFGLIADELRRQYSLGYYPKKPLETGQRHEIKVRVRLPNLVVRARDSYVVAKGK